MGPGTAAMPMKTDGRRSMHYLVDGNNVMAQRVGWHRDKPGARKKLIRDLARFVAVHRAKVRVVFDGSPDEQFPEGIRYKSVRVLYARPGSDADSRIIDLVDKSSYKKNMVVVTSDKALGSHVSRRGAKVMHSGEFRRMIEQALTLEAGKPGDREPVNVEEWLDYFGEGDK